MLCRLLTGTCRALCHVPRFLTLVLLIALPAFGGPAFAETVAVVGSSENTEVVAALALAFGKANPGMHVEVPEPTGSSGGIKAVALGKAALARVARPLKDREVAEGLRLVVFASAPVVFATHPATGVVDLSRARVGDIYARRVTDWSVLGGGPGKIYPLGPEAGDSMHRLMEKLIPGFSVSAAPPIESLGSSQELGQVAARYPGAVVYVPLPVARAARLSVLSLDGVVPSAETLANDSYPASIPLGLVSAGEPQGVAGHFLDFIFSPEGARVIREQGCLPLQKASP